MVFVDEETDRPWDCSNGSKAKPKAGIASVERCARRLGDSGSFWPQGHVIRTDDMTPQRFYALELSEAEKMTFFPPLSRNGMSPALGGKQLPASLERPGVEASFFSF
jgi:hypothetical protein